MTSSTLESSWVTLTASLSIRACRLEPRTARPERTEDSQTGPALSLSLSLSLTFRLPEEIAEHLLGMSGESGELADNVGQTPIGDTLELVRHRELEGAATHRDGDYQPLRQRHFDQLALVVVVLSHILGLDTL